eukprot:Clim_evm12s148 gene=Clim_evmTU12s148
MECPHVQVALNPRKILPILSQEDFAESAKCQKCGTMESVWICLQCGRVSCGRYQKAHAKHHAESTGHCLVLDIHTKAAHCYKCDEFVVNDTKEGDIDRLRGSFSRAGSEEGADSDREWSTPTPAPAQINDSQAMLVSGYHGKEINPRSALCTGKPLGLHNLGNTCFMNAVLQSLIFIRQFRNFFLSHADVQHGIMGLTSSNNGNRNSRGNIASAAAAAAAAEYAGRAESASSLLGTQSLDALAEESSSRGRGRRGRSGSPGKRAALAAAAAAAAAAMEAEQISASWPNGASNGSMNDKQSTEMLSPMRGGSANRGRRGKRKFSTTNEKGEVILAGEVQKLLNDMVSLDVRADTSALSPQEFFQAVWATVPRFRGYQQQDAHEFLRYLLDTLHNELSTMPDGTQGPTKKYKTRRVASLKQSMIKEVFQGQLLNEVQCLKCRHISKKYDLFLDLSLDIPPEYHSRKTHGTSKCDIEGMLSRFCEEEMLDEHELYECGNCKRRERCVKQFTISELPPMLCLHVKRFRWTSARSKIDTFVHFPLQGLDMSPYTTTHASGSSSSASGGKPIRYDLSAVVVHHGMGMGSGHYTAFAFDETAHGGAGQWYSFNDNHVTEATEDQVRHSKAYILFYKKVD